MTLSLQLPESKVLKPQITVFGVGGAGCNATNNMIKANLEGANFVVANTDAQSLDNAIADKRIQLGRDTTKGLGAGASPDVGKRAAEETHEEIRDHLEGSNMAFITAGMGGGTGTGAAPVVAKIAREMGILTVGVVTKPFHFEGPRRMRLAEEGIEELQKHVDTLIIIPNQNLFRVANERTTFAEAFSMADAVLHAGVRGITDLMVMPGLINLDFADVRAVMGEMGKAMMGTGEAEGDKRAQEAAEAAISNPLLDNVSMKGARGVLINITGGADMTLFEVDEAANRIREEVDPSANIIFGSTFSDELEGSIRVSVVATGIDSPAGLTDSTESSSYATSSSSSSYEADSSYEESNRQEEESREVAEQEEIVEEVQQTVEKATEAAYQQLKEDVEKTFASANDAIDDEYFEAIKHLNEEYQGSGANKREEEVSNNIAAEEQPSQAQPAAKPFMAPPAVEPGSYAQPQAGAEEVVESLEENIQSQENESLNLYGEEYEEAPVKTGGLFSKMANKMTRSFHNEEAEREEKEYAYAEEEAGPTASNSDQKQEELLDIPAFLRRKV